MLHIYALFKKWNTYEERLLVLFSDIIRCTQCDQPAPFSVNLFRLSVVCQSAVSFLSLSSFYLYMCYYSPIVKRFVLFFLCYLRSVHELGTYYCETFFHARRMRMRIWCFEIIKLLLFYTFLCLSFLKRRFFGCPF